MQIFWPMLLEICHFAVGSSTTFANVSGGDPAKEYKTDTWLIYTQESLLSSHSTHRAFPLRL
jgi:hypothetical protein